MDKEEGEIGVETENESEIQNLNLVPDLDENLDKLDDPFSEEQEQERALLSLEEEGEILDDETEMQSLDLAADESQDKTNDPFSEELEQEQEDDLPSAKILEPDAITDDETSQNPLGVTADLEETDLVAQVGDCLEGLSTDESKEIAKGICEVNPASFMFDKDPTSINDASKEKEEGEIDDDEVDSTAFAPIIDIDEDEIRCESGKGDEQQKVDDESDQKSQKVGDGDGSEEKESDDEDGGKPMIRMNSSIFESQPDEEDEDDGDMNDSSMDPDMIQNMMEFEMDIDEGEAGNILQGILKKKSRSSTDQEPVRRILPRRAAAQAAASTIKKISNLEQNILSDPDPDYVTSLGSSRAHGASTSVTLSTTEGDRQRCHHCKKMGASLVVVRQYGTDISLCSNSCFNSFRNPDPTKRPLPCAKCGNLNRDTDSATVMYWETMNFCSDLCVGNFQLEIGSKCSTCVKRVAWPSLGKYCVRFGSDIRQFCSALCLESYKKNARVCFHCQLDIKRLGNVVMANIPMKATPKEFCGQECVEMYVEQNLHQPARTKPVPTVTCCICSTLKPLDRELMIAPSVYQICSEKCWQQLLESQGIKKASKCETCPKFINMEYIKPAFYVATDKKAFGFCSATCKNVFVLKQRQILSCTNCKVKKYNYDLIQSVTGQVTDFAVCSLNCLPRPSQYITNLKDTLNPPLSASEIISRSSDSSIPIINSVTSMSNTNQSGGVMEDSSIQISSVSSLAEAPSIGLDRSEITNGGAFSYETPSTLTFRQVTDDDIIEIRDDDDTIISLNGPHENGIGGYDGDLEEITYPVAINDENWITSDISITIGKPPVMQRNKCTSARPVRITKEVQTDSEELWAMPRVEMKILPEEKIMYIPVPIPFPVYLPFPIFAFDRPVPIPFPMGVPVPIPIPIDTRFLEKGTGSLDMESIMPPESGNDTETMDFDESGRDES